MNKFFHDLVAAFDQFLQGVLYEEQFHVFLILTIALGCSAAYATGKAVAGNWRPLWQAVAAAIGLTFVVRFLHFALWEATLLSLQFFVVDGIFLVAAAVMGWRMELARRMTTQYRWLYERVGLFGWRDRVS